MKKLTYLILLLFFGYSYSQDITFSDENLRIRLTQAATNNNIAKDSNGNSIKIDLNDNGIITVAEASLVYELDVSNVTPNGIVSIAGVELFPNLRILDCSNNDITSINLTNLSLLQSLDCSSNDLGANGIILNGCTGLTDLDVNGNNLLSTINFSTLVSLATIDLSSCSFTTVDVSNCVQLNSLNCNNNDLITLFVKNGRNETISFSGGSNSGLIYICADESQIAAVQSNLTSNPTCQVNSFCTDAPGGNSSRLSGYLVFDALNDGVTSADPKFPYLKMKTIIGADVYQTVTDNNGDFEFFTTVTTGAISQSSVLENTSLCLPMPTLATSLNGNDLVNNQVILPISAPLPDLEVVIAPKTQALPNNLATYKVVYKNKGTKTTNARLLLNYNNSLLSFVNASNGAVTNSLNQLALNVNQIKPYETRDFEVTFNVSPTAVLGNEMIFNLSFNETLINTELPIDLADNVFTYKQVIESKPAVFIECLEGNNVDTSLIGKYLHYVISFTNTTTETINDINIVNVIDASKFDMSSLQILYTYHPMKMEAKNNNARYSFRNADVGGPGGSGGILLKIKTNDNITTDSAVLNDADVYLDYDNPLATNNEETIFQTLGVNQNNLDATVSIFPNPTNSLINIKSKNDILYLELYDLGGRLIQFSNVKDFNATIDLSERSAGIFYLKVVTSEGIKVEKVIRK
ncbi:T9SS type A sorting domain-containing protein [Flavobacterium sp.]|uniref:DUF7619 domain-containing protein n=1 Tax=Flavobacterium sp. TaxID=239 RepID=UPI00263486C7|nr:T9SS type A sorting domain-containing protein [Flavobacterium sp.]